MAFSPTGRMMESRGLYRAWLTNYFSTVSLAGLASDDEPILLRKIYVPLVLTEEKIAEHEPEEILHRRGFRLPEWLSAAAPGNVFMVSGEAGSGKTTLISSVVDSFASEVGDELNRRFRGYVPFPIRLREAPLEQLRSLPELIGWWLSQAKAEVPDLEPNALQAFLDGGHGILLLDGLDEVGNLARRARVMRWLRDHPWVRGGPKMQPNTVIVTARPSGFEGLGKEDVAPYRTLFVAPFSHGQIRDYLTRWFELRPLRSDQRQSTVEDLVARLTSSEQAGRLLPLARRPAYLASLAFVHGTRGELPYTRAALYEQLVEAYIEMLDRQKGILGRDEKRGELPVWDRQEKIEVLSAVAFQAHVGATAKQKEKQPWERQEEDRRFLWSWEELERAVRVAAEDGADRFRTIRPEHVSQLTGYFVARTGLLVETREAQYQFGHLSFQEYLTALFVLNRAAAGSNKAEGLAGILFPRLGEPGWLEVGVLVLAIDANRSAGKGHEPVLARLDLKQPAHLALLAQLLSGEEIRFTVEERRTWALVWLAFWATRKDDNTDLNSALRFPANREPLEEVWRSVCAALGNRQSGLDGLVDLIERTLAGLEQPAQPVLRGLDALVAPTTDRASDPEPPAARQAWSHLSPAANADLSAARLLIVPLLGGFLDPNKAEEVLGVLPGRVELFRRPEPGQIQPTRLQHSLDSWSFGSHTLLRNLAEQTPLLWWLRDEFFALRICSIESGELPLILWQGALWKRLLRIEQSWWTSQLISREGPQKDWAQDLVWAWNLEQAWDLKRARDLVSHLDLLGPVLDRSRALNGLRDLDGLNTIKYRELDLERARDLDLARVLYKAQLISALDTRQKDRGQIFDLLQAAVQSISLAWLLTESSSVRRPDLSSMLDDFRDSQIVISPLLGTPFAEKALREWEDVLASPFSPIPLLEEALSCEWEELPADPEGIARLFEKALVKLEKTR